MPVGALLTPQQLRQITKDTASAERHEAEAVAKKAEATREGMRTAFMAREIRPDVMEYLMTAVRHHAEHGEHEPNG